MTFELKPGQFALFKNDKGENDKRPDYRGDGQDLDGNPIEVAAWLRKGNKGTFMSCSFKRKEAKGVERSAPKTKGPASEMDDDIPF